MHVHHNNGPGHLLVYMPQTNMSMYNSFGHGEN